VNPLDKKRIRRSFLGRQVFTTDHRAVGFLYLALVAIAVAIGVALSLVMRTHLAWPELALRGWGLIKPEDYLALVTMHGTLMIFFVLTIGPQNAFPSLILPQQIGARRMAFPFLNAAGFWITLVSLLVLLAAFAVPLGAPISGWTSYPPLSAIAAAGPGQGPGMDCWLLSLALFSMGQLVSAVNILATIMDARAPGMRLTRVPLTVWSWLVSSILVLLAFSVLLAALVLLFCDRHLATSFFIPLGDAVSGTVVGHGDGSPLLWIHLFWFFGHPEVYIAILPGMGLASSIFANFSRRPVVGYKLMAAMTVLIGFLGFLVWGHHMFVSGMNPYAGTAFGLTTMAIAVPSTVEVFSWLGTLWAGSKNPGGLVLKTPMLFALGFLSFFIAGGLTGPILAQPALDVYLHNTFFVVAHFHLIMAMAGAFSLFAGIYYWFPLLTGRLMNETLGRFHFWFTVVGAYGTFLPMHLQGLAGKPRHYADLSGPAASLLPNLLPSERGITYAAFLLAAAQIFFLINVLYSALRGPKSAANPWAATTLEWRPEERFEAADEPALIVYGPYRYDRPCGELDFTPQWEGAGQEE
jgi:cytochrome c oxidase subunit 1